MSSLRLLNPVLRKALPRWVRKGECDAKPLGDQLHQLGFATTLAVPQGTAFPADCT